MPIGLTLKPFGVPLAFTPLFRVLKTAETSTSTRPFRRITMVPGAGTASTFGAYTVLSGPAAAEPLGVLAMPQALLLLFAAGPAPNGAANWPWLGLAGAFSASARPLVAARMAVLAMRSLRIEILL